MKYLPQQEEYLRKTIRDILALNPLITVRGMQDHLKYQTGRSISNQYVMKLMFKARRQVIIESDRKALRARFIEVKERYRVMIEQLSHIVFWTIGDVKNGIPKPSTTERISAIKAITQMDIALMKAELDIGLFENRRSAIEEMLREGLLPAELNEQIVMVFRKWKFRQVNQAETERIKIDLMTDSNNTVTH